MMRERNIHSNQEMSFVTETNDKIKKMEDSHQLKEPVRKSLFTNIPPYLNYLPNGKVMVTLILYLARKLISSVQNLSEAGSCQEHTDTMVDLRECLWRVPVALTHMVDIEERSRASMERCCKVRTLILSSITIRIRFFADF